MPPGYRRLVLDLHHDTVDARVMAAAAELAGLLGLDLHGVFVEDERVLGLAGTPFAREIRLLTLDWSPLDAEQLAAASSHAAAAARRMLAEVADARGVPNFFRSLRGDPATCVAAGIGPEDVLVIAETGRPGAAIARSFVALCEAAFRAPGAVMIVPPWNARHDGTVAVAVRDLHDHALDVAAQLARAAGRKLLVLLPEALSKGAGADVEERCERLGLGRGGVATHTVPSVDPHDLQSALAAGGAGLIVLPRPIVAEDAAACARIAGAAGVPVLVVDGEAHGHGRAA